MSLENTKMSTLKANNGDSSSHEPQPAEDDEYYLHGMAEILDAFPKSGPPEHPTRLSEHLYIGNQDNADDPQLLSALDITHVLNMAGTRMFDLTRSPYKPDSGIRSFLMMPAEDFEDFDILPFMLEAIAFLSRADTSGGCAFVHCNYGVNRSGVVAAAYLMVSEHKPLLQVINELKARRSLILSNVGFRRQLVRFARCRGLLDPVERPARRSPRLESAERTPRGVTPSNDKTSEEATDEPSAVEPTDTNAIKETPGKNGNGEIPPRNGYHVNHPALTISTDPVLNGVHSNHILRPHLSTSRREQLLRDVDTTIETLSVRDGADVSSAYFTYYRPREDNIEKATSPSVHFYERPRPSTYVPAVDYASDPIPLPSISALSPLSHFDSRDHHRYSSDSEDFTPSSFFVDRFPSFYGRTESSNAVLDEYLTYKNASSPSQLAVPSVLPVHDTQRASVGEPFTSRIKPRSYYARPSTAASSVIEDYDEANMSSFLAERNARRPLMSSRRTSDHITTSLDHRRRSASSLDPLLDLSRSGKSPASLVGGYKPSSEFGVLPVSAYTGRWYPTSAGRRFTSVGPAAHSSSYVTGMTSFDSDVTDGMRPVGRLIATRVTPAPGYGPRSNYARSHSVSRLI